MNKHVNSNILKIKRKHERKKTTNNTLLFFFVVVVALIIIWFGFYLLGVRFDLLFHVNQLDLEL